MFIKKNIFIIILIILSIVIISCTKENDTITTQSGFVFKRCTKHDSSPKAKEGDIIFGQIKVLLNNKTVLYSNYGSPERLFVISSPAVGSIDEFLHSLHVGDSALMIAPADSLLKFTRNIETKPSDKLYIHMTVSQIISQKEITGYESEVEQKQHEEEENLTNYVLEKYDRAEKKESGLFVYTENVGQGNEAKWGQRVYVSYIVSDTSGRVYDTNIEEVAKNNGIFSPNKNYRIFDFILGDDSLIAGWNEGVSYMRAGGKSILIVPSRLAYGELPFGPIAPFTPLVIEINLIKVTEQ